MKKYWPGSLQSIARTAVKWLTTLVSRSATPASWVTRKRPSISPILALDIDHTITVRPKFYAHLAYVWVRGGGAIHIVTARPESDREVTLAHLCEMGFAPVVVSDGFMLHMYPYEYKYPFTSTTMRANILQMHADWKALVCETHGVVALIDDSPLNLAACRLKGVYGLCALRPPEI